MNIKSALTKQYLTDINSLNRILRTGMINQTQFRRALQAYLTRYTQQMDSQ